MVMVALALMAFTTFAQVKSASKEDIEKFLKSKTYLVLEDDVFSGFNAWAQENMKNMWKITPFEIINSEQFDQKCSDETASFILISQARFSKTKTSMFSAGTSLFDNSDAFNYTIINLVMGSKSKNLNQMPDLCIVPVAYSEVDAESYDYKYGALVSFMQYYINYMLKNPGKDIEQMVKENTAEIKNYELWLLKEELDANVNTLEKIKKVFQGTVKIATQEEIEQAIAQRNPKVAILHKVGPEGTAAGDSRCWKFIITAAEGKPLYFDVQKITPSKPDAFLEDDFKNLGKSQ